MKSNAPVVPDWMIPEECSVRTRKYGSVRLYVAMNTTRAEKPVLYNIDSEGWQHTPFQTATFKHWLDHSTVRKVWEWLGTQSG